MYVPRSFAETELSTLHAFIERYSFGVLVSQIEDSPFATHLPLLLDRTAGPYGTLVGHVARANPHWQYFTGQNSLAIFSGPHAYISSTWYEAENVVPTWNYQAVHASGVITIVDDPTSLLEIVQNFVSVYERTMPAPWSMDSTAAYVKPMLSQIVGFRLEIANIEGKFQLNQNRSAEQQEKVAAALRVQGSENAMGIAAAMEHALRTREA